MAALYHSLFTELGLELLRESIQNGTKLGITHMSFGDGGGNLPTPDATYTQLINEVFRVQLNRLAPSKENPNWLEADGVIPSAVGGFNIREVGLWADDVMVAYANYPPTYKPSGDQGTAQIKTIRIVLQIDNTANFELKIDASVVMATIQSVEEAKLDVINYVDETKIHYVSSLGELLSLSPSQNQIVYVQGHGNYKFNDGKWGIQQDGIRNCNFADFKYLNGVEIDDTSALINAIEYCKNNNVKQLDILQDIELNDIISIEHGHFTINAPVKIKWVGQGADSLTLAIFQVYGKPTSLTTFVTSDSPELKTDLNVNSSSGFNVGDWILIRSTSNDRSQIYLNHIVKIESINGNNIITDTVRRLPILTSLGQVTVTKIDVVDNFQLIGNPLIYAENQNSRSNGISGIRFQYCVNSQSITRTKKLWFKGFSSQQCSRLSVICEFEEPMATGGGEGYAIQLGYTTHSVAKAIGDGLRHAIDLMASWHNNLVDSQDFNSFSASYSNHCAYEYNNHWWRCRSVNSNQYGFQFGIVSGNFADYCDANYMHDCEVIGSLKQCISFANKGKGLTINRGYFDGFDYALVTSNNDTIVRDATLNCGLQLANSADMYMQGECTLYTSKVFSKNSIRALNLTIGRSVKLVNSEIKGNYTLQQNTTIETINCEITLPHNTSLYGLTTGTVIKFKGGKIIEPENSTVNSQVNTSDILEIDGVEIKQSRSSLIMSFQGLKSKINNCSGQARLSINGTYVNDLEFNFNTIKSLMNTTILSITNYTGEVKALSNKLNTAAPYKAIDVDDASNINLLVMSSNTTSGVLNIPNDRVKKCIIKNNTYSNSSVIPSNNNLDKIVNENIAL
ncbi:phage tail protein [Acinetobacter baumannii]|nr:phage tail protein [Acinetobacter baumannii]